MTRKGRLLRVLCGMAVVSFLVWVEMAFSAPVPRAMLAHREILVRFANAEFGPGVAPIATLAGQVEQESRGEADAISPAGAQGVAQFMPSTARWMGELRPDLGPVAPYSPVWSLRAMCAYMKWLLARVRACDACNRWAMAQASYNGGLGWVYRDAALAESQGLDPRVWWGSVETVNAGRSPAAKRENKLYPEGIRAKARAYEAAGWGRGVCP